MDESDSAAAQPLALERMANLSLAALRCKERDSLFRSACLFAGRGRVTGLFAQQVTLEQHSCALQPKPFFCSDRAWNFTRFRTFQDELVHVHQNVQQRMASRWGARLLARDDRKVHKAQRVLGHSVDFVFRQRQLRSSCYNFCAASSTPSPRERLCHARAERMFKWMAQDAQIDLVVQSSSAKHTSKWAAVQHAPTVSAPHRTQAHTQEDRSLEQEAEELYKFSHHLPPPRWR